MQIDLSFKPYQRSFAHPLRTRHGTWTTRKGWLLRMQAPDQRLGFGEVAPIPWFNPNESLEAVARAIAALPTSLHIDPDPLPQTRFPSLDFALETAYFQLTDQSFQQLAAQPRAIPTARLLTHSAPAAAEEDLHAALKAGYTTFKIKIGTHPIAVEQAHCVDLLNKLSAKARLRMDANGALDLEATESWLHILAPYDHIEFIEQPMPPGNERRLSQLAHNYRTPIALDESVITLQDITTLLEYFPNGPFVLKPALFGAPSQWLTWRAAHPTPTIIYSSAMETAIGYEAGIRIASTDVHAGAAIGYGTTQCFLQDPFQLHGERALLAPDKHLSPARFETLWKTI